MGLCSDGFASGESGSIDEVDMWIIKALVVIAVVLAVVFALGVIDAMG